MTENPLDRIPSFDRVSIRAVVVEDGEDPAQALSEAGIFDAVTLPLVFGEEQPDTSIGDGITPNLTAVLEPDQVDDEFDPSAQPTAIEQGPMPLDPVQNCPAEADPGQQSHPTTCLPKAYGAQPLAPVHRRG
jgi:hypothetical protein